VTRRGALLAQVRRAEVGTLRPRCVRPTDRAGGPDGSPSTRPGV
jgi:hypothetical protein